MSTNHLDNRAGNLRYVERWLNELGEPNRAVAFDHDRRIAGRGVSSGGRKNYAYALRKLDGHTHGVPWTEVTAAQLSDFLAACRLNGYSDATIQNYVSCIKAFLKHAHSVRTLPYEIDDALRILGNKRLPERPVVTEAEETALIAACPTLRDQALVALLLEAGWRIGECLNLDIGGVQFDDKGGAWLSLPDLDEGLKTGWRKVYISRHTRILDAYLQMHPTRDQKATPLFLGQNGTSRRLEKGSRLGKTGAWLALQRIRAKAGVRHFRPHDMRHTSVTRAARNGLVESDLRDRYGWGPTSKMPSRYIHNDDDHKETVARKAAGIDLAGQPLRGKDVDDAALERILRKKLKKLLLEDD